MSYKPIEKDNENEMGAACWGRERTNMYLHMRGQIAEERKGDREREGERKR